MSTGVKGLNQNKKDNGMTSSRQKKNKGRKVSCVWEARGVILVDFLPSVETVNLEAYIGIFERLSGNFFLSDEHE